MVRRGVGRLVEEVSDGSVVLDRADLSDFPDSAGDSFDSAGDSFDAADPLDRSDVGTLVADPRTPVGPGNDPTWTAPSDWHAAPRLRPAADPAPDQPRVLGPLQLRDRQRYQFLGEHGRGGLGRVVRARDCELERDVAIKELLAPGHTAELRFFREALITARLEHPGIVPIHEAGRWPDGTPFYSMKLVAGRSLDEAIKAVTCLGDRLALVPNVIAVADAIAYAHENRIVHRDLKPSNVLVGDFGETVVVDWGLAKSLDRDAVTDEIMPDGPFRISCPVGVTFPGGPLGTPAFMPPEQFVGQSDERSDIFALGGILYHVLSGTPPRGTTMEGLDPNHVLPLRGALPRDLTAIAMRAMAPEPDDRYPSAREFAEDLRRYIRRQPVRARRYSVFARAALGFVRHRAVVSALLLAVVLVVIASLVGAVRSSRQRERAERALDDLALKHAELLLRSDPTGSAALLDRYSGPSVFTRDFLRAEARGLGVARLIAAPHIDTIHFLGASGGAIISVAEDQRVVSTTASGSRVLASDFSRGGSGLMAYAPAAHVLAYGHHMGGVMIRHLDTGAAERRRPEMAVEAVSLSADGARVALLGQSGALAVETVGARDSVDLAPVPGGRLLRFADSDSFVVLTPDSVERVDLSAPDARGVYRLATSDALAVASDRVAVGSDDGFVHVLMLDSMTPIAVAPACKGMVNAVEFVPRRPLVAFACQDGTAGAIDARSGAPVVSFSTQRAAFTLATSPDGRFVCAAGESATVYVYDLDAAMMTRYVGHTAPISMLAAPGDEAAPLISADMNGVIRVWDLPGTGRRVVMRGSKSIFHAAFSPDSRFVVADGAEGIVRLLDRTLGQVTELRGHTDIVYGIAFSPSSDEFATWGYDGTVRVWGLRERAVRRVMTGHRGLVKDGDYMDASTLFTAGVDGRLLAWGADGRPRELFRIRQSFVSLELLRATRSIVVTSAAGQIFLVSERGDARQLAADGQPITMLRASPGGQLFATGSADGTVRVFDASGEPRTVMKASGPIRHIAFSPDASLLAVASEDGRVHLRALGGRAAPWDEVSLRARYVAFSPVGGLLAITCNDGTVWYSSLESRAWSFSQAHEADTFTGQFSPDGQYFASSDGAGVVVLHSIAAIQRDLHNSQGAER